MRYITVVIIIVTVAFSTATFAQTRTTPVEVTNTPTMKIDSTQNTVATTTEHAMIRPWSTNQTVNSGETISTPSINCAGYKEMRVVLFTPYAYSDMNLIQIKMFFATPAGGMCLMGSGNFGAPTTSLTTDANFVQTLNMAYLNIPVISDTAMIDIVNNRSTSITITSSSWIYLVN